MSICERVTWEYQTLPTYEHGVLDNMGAQGWEVYRSEGRCHWLKRPTIWTRQFVDDTFIWVKEEWE